MSYRPKYLGHVNIYVRNVERSHKWYEDVLGLHTYDYMPGRAAFMSADQEQSHEVALIQVGDDAPLQQKRAGGPESHGLDDAQPGRPEGIIPTAQRAAMSLSTTCPIMGSPLAFTSAILMAMVLKYPTNSPEISGRATTRSFLAKAGPRDSFLVPGTNTWPHRWLLPGSSETDADGSLAMSLLSAFIRV